MCIIFCCCLKQFFLLRLSSIFSNEMIQLPYQVFPVRNYVSDSWKNHVDYKSSGDRSDVRSVHGDSCVGPDDPRYHHFADDLLVYNSKKSSGVLQRHDASLGDSAGYGFEVTIDCYV